MVKFVIAGLVFLIFLIKALVLLDPDFGWHYKMGEYIANVGIPSADPFSYTMPSYPFVDHEWLTNVILYSLYNLIGSTGLSILFTLLFFLVMVIMIRSIKARLVIITVPLLLILSTIVRFFGVRPQVQSWLWLVILITVLLNSKTWNKFKFGIPFLFFLWANLHGSFGAGIASFAFIIGLRAIRKRKISVQELLILFLSVMATLINPYGVNIWKELWMQITDSQLRWRISEWEPSLFSVQADFLIYLCFSASFMWRYRRQYKLEEWGIYLAFLSQALGSARHVPLWLVVSYPFTIKGLKLLYKETRKHPLSIARFKKAGKIVLIATAIIFLAQNVLAINGTAKYSEASYYPAGAIRFLRAEKVNQNIFSEYSWGGYLVWQMPEKKVFIDGRMPSWRWNANIVGETNNAMDDYVNLITGQLHHKKVFEKYGIKYVLWPKSKIKKETAKEETSLADQLQMRLTGARPYKFNLIEDLRRNKWMKIYEDDIAVVYQKP